MEFYNLYANEDNMISDTEINTYLATITEANLEEIITQKWLTFAYEQGFEAFAEYRRTGFPQLVDYFGDPVSQEAFPKRVPYPYSEYTLNNSNYNNAIENQGPDDEFTKLWWDK